MRTQIFHTKKHSDEEWNANKGERKRGRGKMAVTSCLEFIKLDIMCFYVFNFKNSTILQ